MAHRIKLQTAGGQVRTKAPSKRLATLGIRSLITALIVFVLAACGADSGEPYVGTWHNPKSTYQVLTISRQGENFRIDTTNPPLSKGHAGKPVQVAALLKDGVLLPQGWGGGVAITHIAESNSLAVQRHGGGTVTFLRGTAAAPPTP